MNKLLDKVNRSSDVKKFSIQEVNILSNEIREAILNRVSKIGGHLASNLGVVELTIAIHYVFNLPIDKVIYDVSHQTYTHKILTGRKNGFINDDDFKKITGFSNPNESECDLFCLGHTSSSISLAYGLAKARDLNNESYNVLALIGDGSLSGGLSFEGLNNASTLKSNLIIVINDNEMSIAENHGGFYNILKDLRESEETRKNNNYFKNLGFDYDYLDDGNNIEKLILLFKKYKDHDKPIVLHIKTLKGNGYLPSIQDKEDYHSKTPFDLNSGKSKSPQKRTFEDVNRDYFLKKLKENKKLVLVTAGTPKNFGFEKELRNQYKNQFFDEGIAEEHTLSFSVGLAKGGLIPVVNISSTFIQRGYDEIAHDICLNNPHLIVLVEFSGVQKVSRTHQSIFDIAMISNLPGINYYSPSNEEEYTSLLDYCIKDKGTYFIRVPSEYINSNIQERKYSNYDKYSFIKEEKDIALIGIGKMDNFANELSSFLKIKNLNSSVIKVFNISKLDNDFLTKLKKNHKIVVTVEDEILDGGYGQKIASFYGKDNIKVLNYGLKKEYVELKPINEVYKDNRINFSVIYEDILKCL